MLGMRSIILWGRNNDSWAFQRPQKIHGIQPIYRLALYKKLNTSLFFNLIKSNLLKIGLMARSMAKFYIHFH